MSDSRGVVQAPAAGALSPPNNKSSSPRWWVNANSDVATVPQPLIHWQPPKTQTSPDSPTPPGGIRLAPAPRGRERPPGGTALDGPELHRDEDRTSWRDLIYRLTRIDPGPSKDSIHERDLRDRIRKTVGSAVPIAVLGLKGGVGKTSVVEALGSTFADVRDDRIIAVDLDAGDLAERHGRRTPRTLANLLSDAAATRYSDVRAHTYMNSFGLEVLGPPDYGRTDWRLERHDVVKAFSILRTHYSVVLVDCVKALNSSVMEAVLPESRSLVVVSGTAIDAIRKTRTTLEWLSNNGYQRLMRSTVLAINHVEPAKPDLLAVREIEQLSSLVGATVVLPFDRHVREGKEIGLDRMSKRSRRSYLEMAAVLADMFPGGGMRRGVTDGHSRSR
jgi:MinD-like ATPase involved in chromosome partitioning or flagellar assembly